MIEYPTVDLVISTNKKLMEKTKVTKAEKHGLLADKKVIEDVIKEMKESKGDIYDKAAILLTGIVQKHIFESGNRRTAFLVTDGFLAVNKSPLNMNRDHIENVLQGIRERFYKL